MKSQNVFLNKSCPIEITVDGTVVSKLEIYKPEGFAITIKANNVTIQECDIVGAINLYGPVHGITIQNNYIHDIRPVGTCEYVKQFAGIMTTEGERWDNPVIQPMGAYDITIRGNYFENCPSGVYLVDCKGPVNFSGNYSRNHRGPYPRGQMIQMAYCDGSTAPILVEDNFSFVDPTLAEQKDRITGLNGEEEGISTGVEDHINFLNSSGSIEYPITVMNNYIAGYSASKSGSGMMLGDSGGSYYNVIGNKVYNTGNAGIGISGGHHWLVKRNRIYQCPPATQYSGRGLQIECYGDEYSPPIIIEDNVVYWECGKFGTGRGIKSLHCTLDFVIFKNNSFGNIDAFDYIDPMPRHEPAGCIAGLVRPWE